MSDRNSLLTRHAINDLVRNKGVNAALLVVLTLSAFLMATGAMVMERLIGSVDQLFEQAQPPHYLQMHKGEYDAAALDQFAADNPEIATWLIEDMLGYDSAAISWDRPSTGESGDLAESLIDNLFVSQNQEFDFLIDETGVIPEPGPGEIYVPVAYKQQFDLQIGDRLGVRTDSGIQYFDTKGFVRDSQMASSLSSATRFLISPEDFATLETAGGGASEIIVEYRLTDTSLTSTVQTAYESNQDLPKNGQAVTYQQIRLINAFSDGLVALALIFVSFLVIAIAMLNLRFVIRGTLEDEVREIGVMKAIGIPNKNISRLYLSKYAILTLVGCIIGGLLAVAATSYLTRSVQANYAAAEYGLSTIIVPLLALALVFGFVVAMCWNSLRAVRRIQVVNALVHGSTLDEKQTRRQAKRQAKRARRANLAGAGADNMNRRLAFLDLLAERKQWILIPIVFFLAAVLMVLPTNLLSTFQSPRFVTYMGAPETDVRADLQFSEDVDSVRNDMLAALDGDDRVADIRVYANVLYETPGEEGWEILRVEVGDYSTGTIEFSDGQPPGDGEIALSVANANKYGLSPGDEMSIRQAGQESSVTVSGVYQDVTSGGFTSKMQGEVTSGAVGYVIYADLGEGNDPSVVAAEYNERFPAAAVIPMQEYVQQTLAYVTDAFRSAAILSTLFGVGVALLIISLFLKLRLTKDRVKIGVLSAIGFSSDEIIRQTKFKVVLVAALGTLLGVLFAATIGESLVGGMIALVGLGIENLDFIPSPLIVYVLYPLLLIAAGYLGAVFLTAGLRDPDKSSWLKE